MYVCITTRSPLPVGEESIYLYLSLMTVFAHFLRYIRAYKRFLSAHKSYLSNQWKNSNLIIFFQIFFEIIFYPLSFFRIKFYKLWSLFVFSLNWYKILIHKKLLILYLLDKLKIKKLVYIIPRELRS